MDSFLCGMAPISSAIHLLRNRLAEAKSKVPLDRGSAAMGFEVEKLSGNAAL